MFGIAVCGSTFGGFGIHLTRVSWVQVGPQPRRGRGAGEEVRHRDHFDAADMGRLDAEGALLALSGGEGGEKGDEEEDDGVARGEVRGPFASPGTQEEFSIRVGV
jgi:hypothetical protein